MRCGDTVHGWPADRPHAAEARFPAGQRTVGAGARRRELCARLASAAGRSSRCCSDLRPVTIGETMTARYISPALRTRIYSLRFFVGFLGRSRRRTARRHAGIRTCALAHTAPTSRFDGKAFVGPGVEDPRLIKVSCRLWEPLSRPTLYQSLHRRPLRGRVCAEPVDCICHAIDHRPSPQEPSGRAQRCGLPPFPIFSKTGVRFWRPVSTSSVG